MAKHQTSHAVKLVSAERSPSTTERDTAPKVRPLLLRPLVVVVPVYNAPEMLEGLIASLEEALPEPIEGLSFLFSDDASPDPRLGTVYKHQFFARPDVELRLNSANLGFIGNVNGAISVSRLDADILILNSDTEVWEDIFTTLQEEAHASPEIASVTPLTNNGTICSVFGFPDGGDIPPALSAKLLAKVTQTLGLPLTQVPAPTGVGFCMYLKREAIEAIGLLDPAYGRGYGEECDWSRRAIKLGWKNFISSKAFVRHVGTQSFLSDEKKAYIAANGAKLLSRFPEYDREVAEYIAADPLKFHRVLILAACLRELTDAAEGTLYLTTLHADPDSPTAGGTEHHVRTLREALVAEGHATLELFPISSAAFELRAHTRAGNVLKERFSADLLPELLRALEPFVGTLHVHHTIHWPETALQTLSSLSIPRKLFTAHDFYQLCPTINLSRHTRLQSFCVMDDDPSTCDGCLKRHRAHPQMSAKVYRRKSLAFLRRFETLLFPSDSLIPFFERAFREDWSVLAGRVEVLHHDLRYITEHVRSPSASPTRPPLRVAFVGALGAHKGADQILAAIPRLREIGFSVEIIGDICHRDDPGLAKVPIRPYRGPQELAQLLRSSNPSIVALPSTWPETFCYGFYEAALLADAAIPVVGPFGHPADVIAREGIGVAMTDVSADALVEACIEASRSWRERKPLRDAWAEDQVGAQLPYLERYRAIELGRGSIDARTHETPLTPDLLWALGRIAQHIDVAGSERGMKQASSSGSVPARELPLRYRLVDEANDLLKNRLPFVHALGRRLARRARRHT